MHSKQIRLSKYFRV